MKNIVKISILILSVLIIVSTALFFYFMPTEQELDIFDNLNEEIIEYKDLNDHLDESIQAYFFCSYENQNCIYTHNEILKPLVLSASTTRFEKIFFVNAKELDENVLPSAIRSRLGFSHYPAFVTLSKIDNKIVVHSVLEWNDDMNFTKVDLRVWMIQNQLWLDEYTD
jgi:hypothetical protein